MTPDQSSIIPSSGANDWRVDIAERGRAGSVTYVESAGHVEFSWEFGGGDTVAILYFEDEATWRTKHPWTAERRAEILQRVADEVIRQKAPSCRAEIDERAGWINLRQSGQTAPPQLPTATNHQAFRERKGKLTLLLAAFVLIAAVAAMSFKSMFSIKSPTGVPLGLSIRTPQHIATLIQALEPYVPSLHRNPGNDRYRLALFLFPLDGSSPGKMIPIAKQLPIGDFNLSKVLGCDGTTVWFNLNGIRGVNLKTEKLIGEADLRRANPSLGEPWDDYRRIDFGERLRVTAPDRQRIFEVVPETLQAVPAQPIRGAVQLPHTPDVQNFLSVGVRPTPTEWLAVLSPKDAASHYKPKSWLSRLNQADDTKELRRLHRGQLGPEQDRGNREIISLKPISDEEFLNAAFVRTAANAEPLRLSSPDSFLMTYTAEPGLGGTLMAARVDAAGKILWKTDTGIDRFALKQILPDAHRIAFIGTRPPVPDKVSEPIFVIVDNQSGALTTSTLWK